MDIWIAGSVLVTGYLLFDVLEDDFCDDDIKEVLIKVGLLVLLILGSWLSVGCILFHITGLLKNRDSEDI